MRAFVTGGSGFVGRNLIAALKAKGHSVRALARSASAMDAVTKAGAESFEGDLSDADRLKPGMEGCDVIFHSAANVKAWGPRAEFYEANVRGTEHVLEAARAAGVKRLVHISTEAVLVDGSPLVRVNETWPVPERPIGNYASTKAEAERRVLSVNSPDFTTVAVRPRFIWGAGDTSLLPELIAAVKAGRFRWFSGGRYLTSTCHVANCVEGALLAAEKGRGGEAYFLTDGEPVVFRDFITAMLATQGVDPGTREVPFGVAAALATVSELLWGTFGLGGRPPLTRTEVLLVGREVTVSDEKARQELGYEGRMTREEGLRDMKLEYKAQSSRTL
ncbi:NAD-dependent epimerase/dehydratase family protein [Pyxidicoccus fallax]|uniref:NAD-dependent epimerase/dehydratase family protein n=1 Tax=Pyxidicoccus fallax TaxID=394095 RepID=A0A848LL14_9BACT|nr:NAD-dependent epimerase/dehydratase family protein [Pyxidicoccus fallax]NMO18399.1 NAD-dependent epimerase/dehydratase family protein [Pyxidicoccus fallax]NPC85498.1 NAD-dependent epimerase/dehydratase family protein [Pyxidicoccus fallax]